MKKIKYIASLLLVMLFTTQAFAEFKFDKAPEIVEQTEDSVKVSWEALDWAFWYYIYYWTESQAGKENPSYEFEWDDLIEGTEYTIGWLESDKTYYVSVVWMDEEAEQTPYSDELKVVFWDGWASTTDETTETTTWENQDWAVQNEASTTESTSSDSLKLEDVTFSWEKSIFLSFNNDLDASEWAQRDVKVTDLSTWEELDIESISLSEKKFLDIVFVDNLKTSTEYEVTVISLSDVNWNNIEVWAYWTTKVMSPESFNQNVEKPVIEEEVVVEEPLEAAPIEPKKLPDTWAKEILLVLAALLLWALLLNFRTRES